MGELHVFAQQAALTLQGVYICGFNLFSPLMASVFVS